MDEYINEANDKKITPKLRKEAEELIYKIYDTLDPTHKNSDYYRQLFSTMDDNAFYNFFKRRLPLRYHYELFENETTMQTLFKAFKILDKPLLEKVNMPHIYRNKNGEPVQSKECLVIYIHIKRMKQMVSEHSHNAMNIEKRDLKTGLLTGEDKGAKETDREFESLVAYDLDYTIDEFSRFRADALDAAHKANNIILTKGSLSEKDINVASDDSIGKNLINTYLMAANIHSNLLDNDYMTPYTVRNKQQQIERM